MERHRIQRFKTLLAVRQHELRLSIEQQRRSVRGVGREPDVMDQAASSYEKETLFEQSRREEGLLQMVESALGRIQDGSFGHCLSCGDEINEKRLLVVPWTQYCIQCQEHLERR